MYENNEIMVSQNAMREIIMILAPDRAEVIFAILREDQKKQTEESAKNLIEAKAIIADAIESNFPMMEEN